MSCGTPSSLSSLAGHISCRGGATGPCPTSLEACGSPDRDRSGFVFSGSVPAEQHGTEGSCLLGAASGPPTRTLLSGDRARDVLGPLQGYVEIATPVGETMAVTVYF